MKTLFTKPKIGKLAPYSDAPRPSPLLGKGKTKDVNQAFEHFQTSRQKAAVMSRPCQGLQP